MRDGVIDNILGDEPASARSGACNVPSTEANIQDGRGCRQKKPNTNIFNENTWTKYDKPDKQQGSASFFNGNRQAPKVGITTTASSEKIDVSSQQTTSHDINEDVPSQQTTSHNDGEVRTQETPVPSANPTQDTANNEDVNCPMCKIDVVEVDSILCETCNVWFHAECLHMSKEELTSNTGSPIPLTCSRCLLIKANNLKWGNMSGEQEIKEKLKQCYRDIITWRKNIMSVPRGKSGEAFIRKLTKLINLFANKTAWQRLSLTAAHVFIPMMLQKPSARSKPRDHIKYLTSRLQKWNDGEILPIMKECNEIQKRMKKSFEKKEESRDRAFVRNMLLGKVGSAAKFVNNEDAVKGVHFMSTQ